jgi:isopentenyl diphosphate isomerase/L-lactate dehydrogenase-like FMN-dependent dehydrogenase
MADEIGAGRARQTEIFTGGIRGRKPLVPVDPNELERRARERLSAEVFAYVAGGAGLESTLAANRSAFERYRIVPRMLRDVSQRDLSVELFGRRLPAPLLLAPVGAIGLVHAEGDLGAARAAASEGVPLVFSNQASVSMEECAAAMGDSPRWFQLYWSRLDELVESFVRRAEACGCEAIVVTLDTPMLGWRPRDLDLAFIPFLRARGLGQYTSDPVFQRLLEEAGPPPAREGRVTRAGLRTLAEIARAHPGGFLANLRSPRPRATIRVFTEIYNRPVLNWDDLPRLRAWTRLPVVVKGVLHADDARRALDAGVDGIVVSNHGGRQLDGTIASLDALPAVVEAVRDRVPVLLDSGVRGGADVVKALALGARAVLVGRPYAYGLALGGEAGVREVIRNLVAELDLTLGLAGYASIADLGPEALSAV